MDWVGKIAFTDGNGPLAAQGQEHKFGFRRLAPKVMAHSHWHGHIEINYLFGCSADYLINGKKISVPQGKMIVFWASFPHQMIATQGQGELVNIYVPLEAFLTWKMSHDFVSELLQGEVMVSDSLYHCDEQVTRIWQQDIAKQDAGLTRQVIDEIRCRLRRMSLEDYSTYQLVESSINKADGQFMNGLPHIKTMLHYISAHYDQKITIDQVANATGLHKNYAMKLFNRVMRTSIKQYINQLRLQHAQALLVDTDKPILTVALEAGFGSTSRFYDLFQNAFSMTPMAFRRGINGEAENKAPIN